MVDLKNFKKSEDELETMLDKWLYLLKYLPFMKERPATYHEPLFNNFLKLKFMKEADDDAEKYTCKYKRAIDHYSQIKTARDVGFAKGFAKGISEGSSERKLRIQIANNLLQMSQLTRKEIAELTKLPLTIVENLSMEKT